MSRILDALRKQEAQGDPTPRATPRRDRAAESHLPPVPPEPARPAAPTVSEATPRPAPQVAPHTVEVAPVWTGPGPAALPESFQRELTNLRVQVDGALAGRRPRVLLFTSSTTGEGTTTVAASFARVLAQDGASRVLLVDANLRRPRLAAHFGLPGGPGLPEVLHGAHPFDDAVAVVERQNLHLLSTSTSMQISSNLYAQQFVRAFLGQYGARYDYVVFDGPPVLNSPETVILGSAVDTTLLVVRASTTKTGVVNRALDAMAKSGVPVLGLVLNRRRLDIPEFLYKRL